MILKAIETNYEGHRFRSRLEARWAVFFNALGIKWKYEKEGYDLDGIWYLPDFWLSDLKVFCEVKGHYPSTDDIEKGKRLAHYSNCFVIIVMECSHDSKNIVIFPDGYILDNWPGFPKVFSDTDDICAYRNEMRIMNKEARASLERGDIDDTRKFAERAHLIAIEINRKQKEIAASLMPWSASDIMAAHLSARQARFEHGESG